MDRINATFTGRIGREPRLVTTRSGQPMISFPLAVDVRPFNRDTENVTRRVQVLAFRQLASHAASSIRKGDFVTVRASDLWAEAWTDERGTAPEVRASMTVLAYDVAMSMTFDTAVSGRATRSTASTEDSGPAQAPQDAAEQADRQVVAGVTA